MIEIEFPRKFLFTLLKYNGESFFFWFFFDDYYKKIIQLRYIRARSKIENLSGFVDFSKMREEKKEKFINNIFRRELDIAALHDNFFKITINIGSVSAGKRLSDFIKKITFDKLKQRLTGKMNGEEIIQVVLEVHFTVDYLHKMNSS